VLAYVFWHRPRSDVEPDAYEDAQRSFHERIGVPSACFRLDRLPFEGRSGYEDWYLVEDWAQLGELNAAAVDATHRPSHDAAAALTGAGWGGIYGLLRGAAEIPAGARWIDKPLGEPTDEFLAGLDAPLVWRRQLVLGPAAELCLGGSDPQGRSRIA
jgi:hypothetical protein